MAKKKNTYSITGRIIDSKTQPVAGLRVEAWDKDLICNDLVGSSITDDQGKFRIEFTLSHFKELFPDRKPDLFFKVYRGNKLIKSTKDTVLWNLKAGEQMVEIKVNLASKSSGQAEPNDSPSQITQVPLAEVLEAAGVGSGMLESFRQKNISEAKDLFTAKGKKLVKEQGLTTSKQQKLLSTAKFAAASGSVEMGKRLAQSGLTSLSRFSRMPMGRVEKMLGKMNKTDRQALHRLSYVARMVSNQTREASIQYQRSLSRDGKWLSPPKAIPIDREPPDYCGDGDPCFNVFSPIAYIFDLLNFIYDNWNIPSDTLEGLFYQEIDSLNCESGLQPVPQIYLAIDVLEKHLGRAKALSASEKSASIYKGCIDTILSLFGIDRKNLSAAARDNLSSSQPTREVLVNAINAIREEYRKIIKSANPLPSAPITNDQDAELKYLMDKKNIEQLRDSAMVEFENMCSTVFSPFLVTYREKLIKESGMRVDQLENWLFIDLRSAPAQMTNRITQVIQSLQSFVLAVRTGMIKEHPITDIASRFAEGCEFDEPTRTCWTWLSEYATWSAAMYVLVYPENVIMASTFRSTQTYGFVKVFKSVGSVATRENMQRALAAYDQHLERVANLGPVSAHVIDGRLYVFARYGYEFWMNSSVLPSQTWTGWKPVRLAEEGKRFEAIGTALYLRGGEVQIVAAFKKSSDDAELPSSITLQVVSLDGRLQDKPSIDKVTIENQTAIPIFETIDDGHGELAPVLTFKSESGQSRRLFFRHLDQDPEEKLDVDAADAVLGTLVDGQYYNVICEYWTQNANRPTLKNLQTGQETTFSFRDADAEDRQGNRNHSPFYVLATNHSGLTTYLVRKTDAGSIICHKIKPSSSELTGDWEPISPGRMDGAFVSLMAVQPSSSIPLFLRQIYFEERYLYFPLVAAYTLNQSGDFVSAHEWYLKLYDPFKSSELRHGFPFDAYFIGDFSRSETWLSDPLDPYAIAAQRKGVYLRHTILMMVKNLLDWANHEFARSGPESINKARELYLLAERILNAPELHNLCHIGLDYLQITITKALGIDIERSQDLDGIDSSEIIKATKDIISNIIQKTNLSIIEKYQQIETAIANAVDKYQEERARMEIGKVYNDSNDLTEEIENVVLAKSPYHSSGADLGGGGLLGLPDTFSVPFPIPPNPLLKAFSFHIQANLAKIHANINIAGDWTPQIPNGDVLGNQYGPTPESRFIEPPRYRYSYLAEKARQQAGYAQQLGVALLQAIEKRDASEFERLQAEHAIAVAEATVTLKELMQREADNAKLVADQQKTRATVQYDFWNGRMNSGYSGGFLGFGVAGISDAEMKGMGLMTASGALQLGAALVYGALALPAMIAAGTGGIITGAGGVASMLSGAGGVAGGIGAMGVAGWSGWGALAGFGTALGGAGMGVGGFITTTGAAITTPLAVTLAGGPFLANSLQALGGAAGTFGSLALTIASFQRRWEDWKLQYDLANIDQTIADLQVTLAQDRINIADQDKQIANLQRTHAVHVLIFLKTKFSNTELYEWMRDVLVQQYRIVMEIATSTALLAQRALEFERQETIGIITNDYWSVDTSVLSAAKLTDEQKSFGILGAERLLTALTQLDYNKLQKDRRHLQISKTISLARLMPIELIELRQNGKITFNTLMEWFDWDFPGHYLRLIKSVKVSVLALVPPIDGIHAMLSNDGVSSVVVNENGAFVKKRAMRTYDEAIALDAAYNETGLFVFDYNDPMFLPFEGLGVETQWTFELPKATNRFNFDTIADVLFTIEYTALHSKEYGAQVKTSLGNHSSACTYLDLRQMFPDQWYHVKNPHRKDGGNVDAQKTDFNLPPSLFPPSLTDISTVHVTLIVVGDLKGKDDDSTYKMRRELIQGISLSKQTKDETGNAINTLMGLVPIQFRDTYAVFSTTTAGVVREFWYDIPGKTISNIPNDILNNKRPPDNFEFLSSLEGSKGQGEDYVSRIRGYIKAPATGKYTFWLSSDDQGELYLLTDQDVFDFDTNPKNKTVTASVPGWTDARRSKPKNLEANKKYYFEVWHKQGPGGDNIAVGWLKPGEKGDVPSEVIPGSQLSLYSEHTIPSKLNPSGQWTLSLGSNLYGLYPSSGSGQDGQRTLIDRIENITIVLTIEGSVQWPS